MGTCAIIVTYFPDPEVFGRLIDAIRDDVDAIAIVNNGGVLPPVSEPSKVHEIRNEANVGLSPALNQGIAWATEHNFTSVIFFDHDSQPSRDMIATLHRSLDSLVSRGVRVAGVGPVYSDPRTGEEAPFVRWGFPHHLLLYASGDAPIGTDFLITSGTLVPMTVLHDLGGMDGTLFIDCVDMDWCFRARAKGYDFFGVPEARMAHSIGDQIMEIHVLGRRRKITIHSPIRLYYIMRNRVLLYAAPATMWSWVFSDMMRIPVKLGIFMLLVPDRLRNTRCMLMGLWHGIIGRRGPAPSRLVTPPQQSSHY